MRQTGQAHGGRESIQVNACGVEDGRIGWGGGGGCCCCSKQADTMLEENDEGGQMKV